MPRKDWSILNIIANAVVTNPGRTGAELGYYLNKPTAYRRLSEVQKLGLVKPGPKKLCDISKRMAITWFPDDSPVKAKEEHPFYNDKQLVVQLRERIVWLENTVASLEEQLSLTRK